MERIVAMLQTFGAEKIAEWLLEKEWDVNQLIYWLQGFDFPPVGHDEPPFVWLLRWIPKTDAPSFYQSALADRLAGVFGLEPDVWPIGRMPDALLYNLLMLCSSLPFSEALASALYSMLVRKALDGKWQGVAHRFSLLCALKTQQTGRLPMQATWTAIIAKGSHPFLPASRLDGFEGYCLMFPQGNALSRQLPREALRLVAFYAKGDCDKQAQIQACILLLKNLLPEKCYIDACRFEENM